MPKRSPQNEQGSKRLAVEELLRRGHWGPVRPGISRQVLVRQLGIPAAWLVTDAERLAESKGIQLAGWALSPILKYGGVEFHFGEAPEGSCWMIFCDDLQALEGATGSVRVDPWWLVEGMPEDALSAHLAKADLPFERHTFPWDPKQIRFHLPSGAALGLTEDADFFDHGTVHGPQRLFSFIVQAGEGAVCEVEKP